MKKTRRRKYSEAAIILFMLVAMLCMHALIPGLTETPEDQQATANAGRLWQR